MSVYLHDNEDYRYEVYDAEDYMLDDGDGYVALDSAIESALENGGYIIRQAFFEFDSNGILIIDDLPISEEIVWTREEDKHVPF